MRWDGAWNRLGLRPGRRQRRGGVGIPEVEVAAVCCWRWWERPKPGNETRVRIDACLPEPLYAHDDRGTDKTSLNPTGTSWFPSQIRDDMDWDILFSSSIAQTTVRDYPPPMKGSIRFSHDDDSGIISDRLQW